MTNPPLTLQMSAVLTQRLGKHPHERTLSTFDIINILADNGNTITRGEAVWAMAGAHAAIQHEAAVLII